MPLSLFSKHNPVALDTRSQAAYQWYLPQDPAAMRQATACLQCRTRKVSCSQSIAARSCRSCQRKNLPCSFAQTTPSGARSVVCEYPDNASHLVELYLHHIHDRPHSLFHEPTLRASIKEKSAGPALVLSICALGCGFDEEAGIRNKRAVFAQAARMIVWNELRHSEFEQEPGTMYNGFSQSITQAQRPIVAMESWD